MLLLVLKATTPRRKGQSPQEGAESGAGPAMLPSCPVGDYGVGRPAGSLCSLHSPSAGGMGVKGGPRALPFP